MIIQGESLTNIEIWRSSTEGGTYTLLGEVSASAGWITFNDTPVVPNHAWWYKLRYRTNKGFYSDFNTAKKGTTNSDFEVATPTNDPIPI